MNANARIVETTQDNFAETVLEPSNRVPVLVDFWAPWCGPCQNLMPVLEKLADDYGGQFLLAKVNIDEQQQLAMEFGVRSVPTVKLVRNGAIVDEFMGAQPESAIRSLLDNHVERESDRVTTAAREAFEAGRVDEALGAMRTVLGDEPDNHRAAIAFSEMLLEHGGLDEAEALLRGLPADVASDEPVQRLIHRLELARAAEAAPADDALEQRLAADNGDNEAKYQLAVRKAAAGQYEPALQLLLEVLQRDPERRESARTAMLQVFDLVGGGELVKRYRSKMASALM